jgi:hypothetical protein
MLLGSFDSAWDNDESVPVPVIQTVNHIPEFLQVNLNRFENFSYCRRTQDTRPDQISHEEELLSTEIDPAQFSTYDGTDSAGEFRTVRVKESEVTLVLPEERINDEPITNLPGSDDAGSVTQNILETHQEILDPETMSMDALDDSEVYDDPNISSVNKGPTKRSASGSEQIDPDSKHGEIQLQFASREEASPSLRDREGLKKGDMNAAASAANDLQTRLVDRSREEADNIPNDLLNDIMPIPRSMIRFEAYSQRNPLNTVKGRVEDATGQQWDWWPLSPRHPPLAFCTFRVKWKCVSNLLFIGFGTVLRYSSSVESRVGTICRLRSEHP